METTGTKSPESTEGHAESPPPDEMFNNTDRHFFDAEDGHAGGVIGKMLALFFLYTVLAMAVVAYWTWVVTH